jgi:hypothetical protein
MANDLEFIGPGSVNQWKKAKQILGEDAYKEALEEDGKPSGLPNYWDGPEDVSRALAETPRDFDKNVYTEDMTLAHLGPVELPSLRLHLVTYYALESIEEITNWSLALNKEHIRLGGIRGTTVPSRSKKGITAVLMKSNQTVKINKIEDVLGSKDAFDGEEKQGFFDKIKGFMGVHNE